MKFKECNELYETWLKKTLPVIESDLLLKHQRMAESPFQFLRATFFRWSQIWQERFQDLDRLPLALSVGDLHIENFGTWRDQEGRLVWGINDFDEAYPLPYVFDLIRLCTSVQVAISENHLRLPKKDALGAVISGYREGLEKGGRPFVLEETHSWLREVATSALRDPEVFWQKMSKLTSGSSQIVPEKIKGKLRAHLPKKAQLLRFSHRSAGLGSLGRARYLAIAELGGAMIARETKPLALSAYAWAQGKKTGPILYQKITRKAFRAQDPFLSLDGHWVTRRLAPHCSKIELTSLPKRTDEVRLLEAMGFEVANIHLGSQKAERILKDLTSKREKAIGSAADDMQEQLEEDQRLWRKRK